MRNGLRESFCFAAGEVHLKACRGISGGAAPLAKATGRGGGFRPQRRRLVCRGFTLVEMMIVFGIIALISAVSIPRYARLRTQSRIREAEAQLEILSAAILQLAWDTGRWPGGLERHRPGDPETWDLSTPAAGLLQADSRFPNWSGPYVTEITPDPWGSPYFFDPDYLIDGQWRAVVGSFGPNRRGRNVYDSDNLYIILDKP